MGTEESKRKRYSEDTTTRPKPIMLRAQQTRKWHIAGAVAELIDNSFGPQRGDAQMVKVYWDERQRRLTVLDNGCGILNLRDLFRLGESMTVQMGRRPGDIGEFGVGGTQALLYLSSEVDIWSLREGRTAHTQMVWAKQFAADDFFDVPTKWYLVNSQNCPDRLRDLGHGTMIEMKVLKWRNVHASNVRRHLSNLFALGLRKGKEIWWSTEGEPPFRLTDPMQEMKEKKEFDVLVTATDDDDQKLMLTARACFGIDEDLPVEKVGVDICYGYRIIEHSKDCLGNYASNGGVYGWVELDDSWQGRFATEKDEIDNKILKDALMAAIFKEIEPLLQQAKTRKTDLVFTEIFLEMQRKYSSGQWKIPVSLANNPGDIETTGSGPGKGPGGSGLGSGSSGDDHEKPDPEKHAPGEGPYEGLMPSTSAIEVVKASDLALGGSLSAAEVVYPDGGHPRLVAYVNVDHPAVTMALEATPANRALLAHMVSTSLAYQIQQNPKALKALFKKYATVIEEKDEAAKAGLITRLLMDRLGPNYDKEKHDAQRQTRTNARRAG